MNRKMKKNSWFSWFLCLISRMCLWFDVFSLKLTRIMKKSMKSRKNFFKKNWQKKLTKEAQIYVSNPCLSFFNQHLKPLDYDYDTTTVKEHITNIYSNLCLIDLALGHIWPYALRLAISRTLHICMFNLNNNYQIFRQLKFTLKWEYVIVLGLIFFFPRFT